MAAIVLRSVKGIPLTIAEADANFTNLNAEVGTKLAAANYTAADVLAKLLTVDGSSSGLDADKLDGLQSATANTASTIVARDEFGNFSAGTITATSFVGNLTGNVTGSFTGTLNGNSSNINGILSINNGGTGATTAALARTNLELGTISTQASNNVSITGGSITGITDITIADGGTGASTVAQARTNLGLVIGSDVQPFSNNLTALAAITSHGFFVKNSAGTAATRSIVGGTSITVTNSDGISGNPTISLSSTPELSAIIKTGTNGIGDIGQTGNRFGTLFGTSTSAQYADLAEKYTTDVEYEAGTVLAVAINGNAEATQTWQSGQRVLGVISTNPAFLMNDEADGQAIALRGRVPVKVVGPIRKGQPLICNQDGKGMYGDTSNSFALALETNEDANVKLVECVIL